jgi:hypothetical protein
MESRESRPRVAASVLKVGEDAEVAQIADAILSTWSEVDEALRPVIGHGGVVALYKRSLYLTIPHHPWLTGAQGGVHATMDLATLKATLVQQSSADAAAACSAFLVTFKELLTSLVGLSLTERLLRSVWANSSSGPPAQDNSP